MDKHEAMPNTWKLRMFKFFPPGELFGKMKLGSSLSEDTPAGRLILTNWCQPYKTFYPTTRYPDK